MPVKSAKQFRFMEAAAHGGLSNMAGPSKAVASEFLDKTSHATKSSFAKQNKFSSAMRKKKVK